VLHQVGAGTLGPVYRAHDAAEGRLVAIKAFHLDLPPGEAVELARRLDALVARNLSHPSIAAPIAAGVEGAVPWLAQEYVPAESLDAALGQYGPPPAGETLQLLTHLAGALDFAAAAGVLHGALHPRDVLVAPGETTLVDLGVAAALEHIGVRRPAHAEYVAPEQLAGAPVTRAGDIYSLGAIAWELLAGGPLPGPGTADATWLPPLPGADVEAIAAAIGRATAEDPNRRPGSALAFAAALRGAVHDMAAFERARIPVAGAAVSAPGLLDEPPESWAEPVSTASELSIEPETSAGGAATHSLPQPAPDQQDAHAGVGGPSFFDVDEPATREERSDDLELHAPPALSYAWESESVSADAEGAPRRSPQPAVAARPRSRGGLSWQVIAVLLVLGVTFGFGGAYVLLGRSGAGSTAGVEAPANEPAAAPASAARPASEPAAVPGPAPTPATAGPNGPAAREFTDNTVPEPPAITSAPSDAAPSAPKQAPPPSRSAEQPAATRRSAAATPATGQLTVRSRPSGATVTVNGRQRGETPLTLENLTYGAYDLRLSQTGYQAERRRVTLTVGRRTATVDVPLRRTRAAAAEDRSSAPPPAPRTASGQFVGAVLVESRPSGASVFIDGKLAGTTPLSIAEVSAGSHVVRIDLAGHNRWSSAVRVVAGERVRVAASLEEETVR
jgi:hypothetical protein